MRRGFTIVEMLGATVLAALLMAAALTVVGSLGRTQRALDQDADRADASADVFRLLRFDLANATELELGDDAFTLRGTNGLARDDLRPTLRRAEVQYAVEEIAGRRWLVRTQRDLDDLTNRRPMRRPLRDGVVGVKFEPLGVEPPTPDVVEELRALDDVDDRDLADLFGDEATRAPPLPRSVRVTITTFDAPPASEVLHVR